MVPEPEHADGDAGFAEEAEVFSTHDGLGLDDVGFSEGLFEGGEDVVDEGGGVDGGGGGFLDFDGGVGSGVGVREAGDAATDAFDELFCGRSRRRFGG